MMCGRCGGTACGDLEILKEHGEVVGVRRAQGGPELSRGVLEVGGGGRTAVHGHRGPRHEGTRAVDAPRSRRKQSHKTDSNATRPAKDYKPINYPVLDGVLTFDLLTNLQRSCTYLEDDQPSHLRIKLDVADVPEGMSLPVYAGPESRFCPAGVYEYVDKKFVINTQNCIHCKWCSIKMPQEYIKWICTYVCAELHVQLP